MKAKYRCAIIGQHPMRFRGALTRKIPNAQLMAYRRIVKQSDMLVAVYDPELASGSAEDKAMAYALALGKPTLLIHPNTWKKKWLNVVKREGEQHI